MSFWQEVLETLALGADSIGSSFNPKISRKVALYIIIIFIIAMTGVVIYYNLIA